MQNTMLDTTVSVPDQELSSVEYIDARENSIATITRDGASVQDVEDPRSLQLIFGQKHNDIDCALCLTAKRACNRAWVTAKQIENWSKMSTMTLWRRLNKLEDVGRICRLSDMVKCKMPTNNGGYQDVRLYNLNVLNQLAMTCIDNEKLNEMSCKFSDILSEVETTGSYVVTKPEMSDEEIMSRALEIAHRTLALREERIKALEAERDEAIRTKAMIGSKREATAMATASAKSKECKRLETENDLLTTENSRLRQDYLENKDFCKQLLAQKLVVYVEKTLRDKCSKALQELSSLMEIPRLEWKEFSDHAGKEVPRYAYHKDVCKELKQRIIDNPKYLRRF